MFEESNDIITEQGVIITCMPNYNIGELHNHFMFAQREGYSYPILELSSDGYIYKADFFDSDGNLIDSKECDNTVEFNPYCEDTDSYIDKVILYIEYEENLYTAELFRLEG